MTSITERHTDSETAEAARGITGGEGPAAGATGSAAHAACSAGRTPRTPRITRDHPRYKWVALSNTTLGVLLSTLNSSIVLISPAGHLQWSRARPARAG